ncbi:MAG: hypothetical protein LW809_04440 [Vampirovibrionales bacterium]|jgi:hypothetical protein|nr:hypothetical protein [Vampirovibrionales bacterium]
MPNDYLDSMRRFLTYRPKLDAWQQEEADEHAQKKAYYQAHPLSPKDDFRIKQKINRILEATTVMDEEAEEAAHATELTVGMAVPMALEVPADILSIGGSVLLTGLVVSKAQHKVMEFANGASLALAGILLPLLTMEGLAAVWEAQQQMRASRIARRHAREEELANPNRYAIFTPQQLKVAEKLAPRIPNHLIIEEDKKKKAPNQGLLGNLRQLRTLLKDPQKNERNAFFDQVSKRLKQNPQSFKPSTEKDLEEDQALISGISTQINERSERYVENIENATETLADLVKLAAVYPTFLMGSKAHAWMHKALKGQKHTPFTTILEHSAGLLTGLVALIVFELPVTLIRLTLERKGAQIARWKAREALEDDPTSVLPLSPKAKASVEHVTSQDIRDKSLPQTLWDAVTLPFSFLKDYQAYQKWATTEGLEEEKRRLILDKTRLSPQQLQDAKRLQARTHQAFSLTDEYAAQDSEMMAANTEMMLSLVSQGELLLPGLLATGIVAGRYLPLPKNKWLETQAKQYKIPIETSPKKWEPLLQNWRLDVLNAQCEVHQKQFMAWSEKKLDALTHFFEKTPLLQFLGQDLKQAKQAGVSISSKDLKVLDKVGEALKEKHLRKYVLGGFVTMAGVLTLPFLVLNSVFTRLKKEAAEVGLIRANEAMKNPNFFRGEDEEEKDRPYNI